MPKQASRLFSISSNFLYQTPATYFLTVYSFLFVFMLHAYQVENGNTIKVEKHNNNNNNIYLTISF